MDLLGPTGLRNVALASHENLRLLQEKLTAIDGVQTVFQQSVFHETVLRLPAPVDVVLNKLAEAKIQGGFSLRKAYPEFGECVLVCATETKTPENMDVIANKLREVLNANVKKKNEVEVL